MWEPLSVRFPEQVENCYFTVHSSSIAHKNVLYTFLLQNMIFNNIHFQGIIFFTFYEEDCRKDISIFETVRKYFIWKFDSILEGFYFHQLEYLSQRILIDGS